MDRNSIKRIDMGYGREMVSFRVAPPYAAELADTKLGKAVIGRDIVTDYDRLAALIDAIDNATAQEMEMARPILLFHIEELKDFLQSTSWRVRDTLDLGKGPAALISGILNGVSKDIRSALQAVDRDPRKKAHQYAVRGSMQYLAELLALTNAAAEVFGADWDDLTTKASVHYVRHVKTMLKMAKEMEPRYAGITERFGVPDEMLRGADDHVRTVDMSIPEISVDALDRITATLGSRDVLWSVYNSPERLKSALENGYRVLSERDTDELKGMLGKLFRDVNRTFNSGGVVAELMMATTAIRYIASIQVKDADTHTERRVRLTKQALYESKADHQERIEKMVTDVPKERFFSRANAAALMSQVNVIADLLGKVHENLHPDLEQAWSINFHRLSDGILCGDLPDGRNAIVLVRDTIVAAQDAVYLANVPKSELDEFFDIHKAKEFTGTNFFSVDEALNSVTSDFVQEMFFNGIKFGPHNGFEILAKERSEIRKKLSDGASIEEFSEYDGTIVLSM
jgi:hypothetical protein